MFDFLVIPFVLTGIVLAVGGIWNSEWHLYKNKNKNIEND